MTKPILYEPTTAITDLMIAVLAVYIARELHGWHSIRLMNIHWHWGWAFWSLGFSALMGAAAHGLGPHFSENTQAVIWKLTVLPIGFTSIFFLIGTFHHSFDFNAVRWLTWVPAVFLAAYLFTIFKDDSFLTVVKFYGPAMGFVLAVMLYSHFGLGSPGAGQAALGLIITFLAAGVQVSGFSLHQHFNHNDLFHVIQMAGLYFIYRGSLELLDYGVGA